MLQCFNSRCLLLCFAVVAGFSGLSWRLIDIQLVNRQRFQEASKNSSTKEIFLPASRGHILDRNDELIARSVTVGNLKVNRYHLNEPDLAAYALAWDDLANQVGWSELKEEAKLIKLRPLVRQMLRGKDSTLLQQKHLTLAINYLAQALEIKRDVLRERIERNPKEMDFSIEKDLSEKTYEKLEAIIADRKLQGFYVEKSTKRRYASPFLASHIVGYTSEKQFSRGRQSYQKEVGNYGAEISFENYLAGKDGKRVISTNALGMLISPEPSITLPPRPGLNIQLTIDQEIQTIAQEELERTLHEHNAPRGTIIVMNPKNGEILGMASYPTFDLNTLENANTNGANFATQSIYEPGSTFKMIAFTGALNEGLITPNTNINCNGGFYKSGAIELKDHHPYGSLTAEWVLGKSSNIGIYKIASQLGTKKFFQYVRAFGFGEKTKIDLSGEVRGRFRETNNPTEFSSMTFGYALSVTPLQIACAYSVIAGNGNLLKPQILKAIIANDGTPIKQTIPEIVREVITEKTAKKVRQSLTTVVSSQGTAIQASVSGFKVAGKTGTAKKYNPAGGYFQNRYTVSFAGMLPADNPAFVCVVVIDDPRSSKTTPAGGTIAAPAFSRTATRVAQYLNLIPTEAVSPTVVTQ
jgi:cell division protein FtsI/penicillin-binding protein 2